MDYEWALCFKIDCDLARQKTGSIEDAIVHYIQDAVAANAIIERRQNLEEIAGRGRPKKKSNFNDLKERYGDDPETLAWLRQNRQRLNRGKFSHDDYLDSVFSHAISLEEFNDEFSSIEQLNEIVIRRESRISVHELPSSEEITK
jgi:hypothetical protein